MNYCGIDNDNCKNLRIETYVKMVENISLRMIYIYIYIYINYIYMYYI